jgi:hypothetical protein
MACEWHGWRERRRSCWRRRLPARTEGEAVLGDHRPRGQAAGGGAAVTHRCDFILIRVLPLGLFPQDRACHPARTTYRWRPLRTAQLRWRVDQTWTKLSSMGVRGPVRSRTPLALRSSATRDRSAGRARQGRYSSSHERIAYEDPRRWPVRGSSPLRQTRDGSGESDEGDHPLQVRPT